MRIVNNGRRGKGKGKAKVNPDEEVPLNFTKDEEMEDIVEVPSKGCGIEDNVETVELELQDEDVDSGHMTGKYLHFQIRKLQLTFKQS